MNIQKKLDEILALYSETEQEYILRAYAIAEDSLKEKFRENGHPFIEHPLAVAHMVANEIGLDYESIVAVFIHEASRFNDSVLEKIDKDYFSESVIEMAICLNKIAAINKVEAYDLGDENSSDSNSTAENYKKLIVSYSKDPRVIIIKLVDRLDVMRHISLLPPKSRINKAKECYLLYIPIAHQLGLYNLKAELEDIYFKYGEIESYRRINNLLKSVAHHKNTILNSFIKKTQTSLSEYNITANIKSRTKAAYSIWKKMINQGIRFEDVQDLFAVRIIVDCPVENEIDLCWRVYSLVTKDNTPDESRLRNWLDFPKSNGYQSLHTTITTPKGDTIEVQIRSKRMDLFAESGQASHWSYKGINRAKTLDSWLSTVKETLEKNEVTAYQEVRQFTEEEVLVYTPDKELKRLKAGSTVLDYAFSIHTNLGLSCIGGKINGRGVPIRERLNTGDTVEIIRSKNNQNVNPDWLNFVVTSKARTKIRQKIREIKFKNASLGKETLERRLKNWKLEFSDEDRTAFCKKYKFATTNDLYAAIGDDIFDIHEIKAFLNSTQDEEQNITTASIPQEQIKVSNDSLGSSADFLEIGDKLSNIEYTLAACCNPIYGDDIFGYMSLKGGLKIHRITCSNATRLLNAQGDKIIRVNWKKEGGNSKFSANINIIIDDLRVNDKIVETLKTHKIEIYSSRIITKSTKNNEVYILTIQALTSDNKQLEKISSVLNRIAGVLSVKRA